MHCCTHDGLHVPLLGVVGLGFSGRMVMLSMLSKEEEVLLLWVVAFSVGVASQRIR